MKNIHLLPTEKPSRLFKVSGELKLTRNFDFYNSSEYQHIYITSDEEIKKGDWVLNLKSNGVYPIFFLNEVVGYEKKIILTTDQELIKYGVEVISDNFLIWFTKNPNCEFIELIEYQSIETINHESYTLKEFIQGASATIKKPSIQTTNSNLPENTNKDFFNEQQPQKETNLKVDELKTNRTVVQFLEEKLQGHLDISRRYWNELLKEAAKIENERMIDLVQSLKDYTRESNNILGHDEREASEFVDIFLQRNLTFKKK
jgi:hypothetical protein